MSFIIAKQPVEIFLEGFRFVYAKFLERLWIFCIIYNLLQQMNDT
jgi:hypothetical protein